eukprot:TRINITY_DN45983_c0_g1_i1.p1 TRINITY_DN45983_c0_g1~~TRINITY_DN45983_c0_g1_i1.p1  ORF type:complete len:647 (-),score=62.03 TRINITY_DN45983_c0_g1_i1:136-1839(-)
MACCSACAADAPHCLAWVFNHAQAKHRCHLHPDALRETKVGHCTSGPMAPSPSPPAPLPRSARNLLYIVVDDLRAELLYTDRRKGIITPAIDALAAKGTAFTRAYVQQGVCSPSRNSFLSGRRPDTTQVWNFENSFRDTLGNAVSSWPGAFKLAGYTTIGLGKVFHPGHPGNDDGALSWSLDEFPYYHPSNFATKISSAPDSHFQDGMITDKAIEYLRALPVVANSSAAKPFFMAVGFHKPHQPWIMPQRFLDMQLPLEQTDVAAHNAPPQGFCNVSFYRCARAVEAHGVLPWEPAPKVQQQQARRLYRAAVSWIDYNVKRILDELHALGLADSTAIVFHGDHGWHLGEHGSWCKQSNFELVARVPLIVSVPWLPQSHGTKTGALVELVDLMPTTLNMMGIAGRASDFADLEGSSFLSLLETPEMPEQAWKNAAFTQFPRCNGTYSLGKTAHGNLLPWKYPTNNPCQDVSSEDFQAMGLSIRTLQWRYTLWLRWDGATLSPLWKESPVGEELYDHRGDMGDNTDNFENVNLATAPEYTAVKHRLREQLKKGWKFARPSNDDAVAVWV